MALDCQQGAGHAKPSRRSGLTGATLPSVKACGGLRKSFRHQAIQAQPRSGISFTSEDPILAGKLVNRLTSNYIDKESGSAVDATQKASDGSRQQMLDLKAKLEKSQDELQKYAADNDLLFLETGKGNSENVVNQSLRNSRKN